MRWVLVLVVLLVACGGERGTVDAGPPDTGPPPVDAGPVPVCEGTTATCPAGFEAACDDDDSRLPRWRCTMPAAQPATCILDNVGFSPECAGDEPTCEPGETPVCVPPDTAIGCPGTSCTPDG